MTRITTAATAILALAIAASESTSQCQLYDFEAYADGANATNIIPGATITASQSCPGDGIMPIIRTTPDAASGTKVLSIGSGCPDFSPDYLTIAFSPAQDYVAFKVGALSGLAGFGFEVIAYGPFNVVLFSETFESATGTNYPILIETADPMINRVTIRQVNDSFEVIDDLRLGKDTTPPIVNIDAPAFLDCECGGSGVRIEGTATDPDGRFERRVLSYRSVDAPALEPWTEAFSALFAAQGLLFIWDTSDVPDGRYYVRVDGENSCGLTSSDVTTVRIDRDDPNANISGFRAGRSDGALCGTVEILGGVSDECGVSWDIEHQLATGGPRTQITAAQGGTSCILTEWDTTTVADGVYRVRLSATDTCGNTNSDEVIVEVDNSRPCIDSADIVPNGVTDVLDLLGFLDLWFQG